MARAVVVVLVATAILFFLVQSLTTPLERKGRGLNRRLGYKIRHHPLVFDPLPTEIERDSDKKGLNENGASNLSNLEKSRLSGEVLNIYRYLTADGKINTTARLMILFPLLDREPTDNVVSFNELEAWVTQRAMDRLDYTTLTELQSKDKNGDLAISFREYLPQFSEEDIEKNEMGQGQAGWWQERFAHADIDHNGLLNFTELRDFLHPEDSNNQEMLKWLLRDRLMRMDHEVDGKLNFSEFEDHVYETYSSFMQFETFEDVIPSARQKFIELDVNEDNFLSLEELVPIIHFVYPGELSYTKYYTEDLINEADDNEDGVLSLQEMLDNESIFYNTVHTDVHEDEDEDDHDRDEL